MYVGTDLYSICIRNYLYVQASPAMMGTHMHTGESHSGSSQYDDEGYAKPLVDLVLEGTLSLCRGALDNDWHGISYVSDGLSHESLYDYFWSGLVAVPRKLDTQAEQYMLLSYPCVVVAVEPKLHAEG